MTRGRLVLLSVLIAFAAPGWAFAQPGAPQLDDAAGAVATLIRVLLGLVVSVAIAVAIAFLLYPCFQRIPPQHRQMEPWQVYLLLIPCFSLVWNFMVYPKLARSYQSYFGSVGRKDVGDCGEKLGLWYSIAAVCCLIPLVRMVAWLAALVLLILFLVKAYQLRGEIPAHAKVV